MKNLSGSTLDIPGLTARRTPIFITLKANMRNKEQKAEHDIKKNHNSDIITSQENPRNMTIESEKNCNASEVSNMV